MCIFDSHVHLFTSRVVGNVAVRNDLVKELNLNVESIGDRLSIPALFRDMEAAGVRAALMLPTAEAQKVPATNRDCVQKAADIPFLYTAGTLHPDCGDIDAELSYLNRAMVHVIKLCSFSQKFSLSDPATQEMFERIQSFNGSAKVPFSVILDTLTLADRFFGTDPAHTTTPRALMDLVERFQGIRFIGAHMGGLGAPFEVLDRWLEPAHNFYLDTSNAMHTLTEDQFLRMLRRHGPERILFGTDWPWFIHKTEMELLDSYMDAAGFTRPEKQAVFSANIEALLGLRPEGDAVLSW